MHNRNSIIELLRFVFALWVVGYHRLLPFESYILRNGYLACEFFFIICGITLLSQIKKYDEHSFGKGLLDFTVKRLSRLGIVVLVAWCFATARTIIKKGLRLSIIGFSGFLWFIGIMLFCSIFYFCLHRAIKKKKTFIISVAVISILMLSFYAFNIANDYTRGLSCIGIGICLYNIPLIKRNWVKWLCFSLAIILTLSVIVFMPIKIKLGFNTIVYVISFALLIYFAFQVDVKLELIRKINIYLGSLSLSLYVLQEVVMIVKYYGIDNRTVLFLLLLTLSILSNTQSLSIFQTKKNNHLKC